MANAPITRLRKRRPTDYRFMCMEVGWTQPSELAQVPDMEEHVIWKSAVLDSIPVMPQDQITKKQLKSMSRLFGKCYAHHMARDVKWLAHIFKDFKVSLALDMSLGMGCSMRAGMYSEPPLPTCGLVSNDAHRAMVERNLDSFCNKLVVDVKHNFWHEPTQIEGITHLFASLFVKVGLGNANGDGNNSGNDSGD